MGKLYLSELIGNKDIRTQLMIAHGASRLHNRAMGHMLFSGLAGCGKTTTAKAVASLSEAPFFEVNAEAIKTAEELAKLFEKFPGDGYDPTTGEKIGEINPPIVFIDEAHRLTLKTEEMLGIAMENFVHTFSQGRGKRKVSVTAWVPEFTLVCATTKEGELSKPFRDRFKLTFVFNSYGLEESKQIVRLHAEKKQIPIDEEAVEMLALRGRGTPRILVRFLDNMHDSMAYLNRDKITADVAEAQFDLMGIDPIGLTSTDTRILIYLYENDHPTGLDSLAVKTNIDPRTIADVNEPFLIRMGLIERTRGGRVITDRGIDHLIRCGHVKPPKQEPGAGRILSQKKRG